MASPFVYHVGDRLSLAELTAACLDGHLVELGDAFIPADAVETAALRARSLAPLLGDHLAATHLTAAWVHGARTTPPVRHAVQRAVDRRTRTMLHPRVHYRDGRVRAADLVRVGGVWVTSPARTIVDLVRTSGEGQLAAARMLARLREGALDEAVALLRQSARLPNKRRALVQLDEWARQDDVTR